LSCSATVYLGLGANLGDRIGNIRKALALLSEKVSVEKLSSVYETEPVGYSDQPIFLNAVCRAVTQLKPDELLSLAKATERSMGRTPSFPNAPRPVDIDILLYGDLIVESPGLVIPHPRLQERAFVLIPLAEIAPDLVHPLNGRTVREMLMGLSAAEGVTVWHEEGENV
jgi:GTP cyclohydrolase IV